MTNQSNVGLPGAEVRVQQMRHDVGYTLENAARVPLPRFFQTSFGNEFTACIGCAEPLESLPPYLVVKEVRGGETIVEYAICSSCHSELDSQYSEESRRCITQVFADQVDFRSHFQSNLTREPDWGNWVTRCVLSREQRGPGSEYQAVALCQGRELLLSAWPYVITGPGMRLLEGCYSAQTLAVRDRFIRQRLGLPSILSDHPATRLRHPPL